MLYYVLLVFVVTCSIKIMIVCACVVLYVRVRVRVRASALRVCVACLRCVSALRMLCVVIAVMCSCIGVNA